MTIVNSETLPEFLPVTAATKHFDQVTRQKEQEPDRPKQIVDKTNHEISDF